MLCEVEDSANESLAKGNQPPLNPASAGHRPTAPLMLDEKGLQRFREEH